MTLGQFLVKQYHIRDPHELSSAARPATDERRAAIGMTMGTESKAETMDTQDGMVAKDRELTALQAAQPAEDRGAKPGQGMTLAARALSWRTAGMKAWQGLDARQLIRVRSPLEQEFPQHAGEWVDPVSRRGFMKLMGASMALAGLAGCTKQPDEPIYPYVKAAGRSVLGKPMYFATAHPVPDRRGSGAGQERRVPADQGRRQPRAPDDQGASDAFTARARCWACTIRTARSTCSIAGDSSFVANFQAAFAAAIWRSMPRAARAFTS